jgi:hypothetical protein
MLSGSNGHGPHAPRYCVSCAQRHVEHPPTAKRLLAEAMWADGATTSEIRAATGYLVQDLRARGADLPYRRTPEQVARLRAGRWGRF